MSELNATRYHVQSVTPVLRMFDVAKAMEFYCDYLGFSIEWEHRYEPNFPLYMQLRLGDCILHLSEHHGDATPGSQVRILTTGVTAYHQELSSRNYKYANPGLETMPWNSLEVQVSDPFGNRIVFYEPK